MILKNERTCLFWESIFVLQDLSSRLTSTSCVLYFFMPCRMRRILLRNTIVVWELGAGGARGGAVKYSSSSWKKWIRKNFKLLCWSKVIIYNLEVHINEF